MKAKDFLNVPQEDIKVLFNEPKENMKTKVFSNEPQEHIDVLFSEPSQQVETEKISYFDDSSLEKSKCQEEKTEHSK